MKTSKTIQQPTELKEEIIQRLKALKPERNMYTAFINASISHEFNIDNLFKMLKEEITRDKSGMGYAIGYTTVDLIIKYFENE